jgi:hypothetical protein
MNRFNNYLQGSLQQLNFNDYYKTIQYINTIVFNTDNYNYTYTNQAINYTHPVDIINIYAYISYKLIDNSIKNNSIPNSLVGSLILWCNNTMVRLYNRYQNTINLVASNQQLNNTTNNATLYYSLYPSQPFTVNNFCDSFFELLYKSSWIGNISITKGMVYTMLTDMYKIGINENSTVNNNKNLYNLEIINYYTFNQSDNDFIIDTVNNIITIINYDNHYISSHNIIITLNSMVFPSTDIKSIRRNILTNAGTNLIITFSNLNNILAINNVLELTVTFALDLPLLSFGITNSVDSFNVGNITYSNNDLTQIVLLRKNSDNLTYNINQFNNDRSFTLLSRIEEATILMKISKFTLLFLTIEYIDISNIIKPNMTDISPPIMQTTSQPYVILPPIVTYTNLVLDTTVPGQLENITYYYSVTFYTDENESNSTPFNNSITVTNNSNSSGKEPTPQIVDVYDTEFAKLIAA